MQCSCRSDSGSDPCKFSQRDRGDIEGKPHEVKHQRMSYDAISKLTTNMAVECALDPGPNRKFTGHSTRRGANTSAYQSSASERLREKRFGYAEGSTAMRVYETPDADTIRQDTHTHFAFGNLRQPAPVREEVLALECSQPALGFVLAVVGESDEMMQVLPLKSRNLPLKSRNHCASKSRMTLKRRSSCRLSASTPSSRPLNIMTITTRMILL